MPRTRMNPNITWVALALLCLSTGGSVSAQTGPTITYQLRAKDFDNSPSAQLLVTADVPATFARVEIQFVSPPGFLLDSPNVRFDPQAGKRIVAVNLRRTGDVTTAEYSILAHAIALPSGSGGSPVAVDQTVNFTYTRRLEVKFYFLLGLAGFVLGYFLRLVTGVLKRIPVPAPALPTDGATGQDGPITIFVKHHYYAVDFGVSLALAFAVLLYLMKEGHPPDSAAAWYGAVLTGIGLGFLTNNDLLARIKV